MRLVLKKYEVQKAIDTFCDFDTKKIAVEFKFHRQYNSSQPKPMHAGQLFSDLNRLSFLNNNIEKYLVYITDEDMRNYEGELYQRLIGLDPKGKGDNFKLSEQKEESKTFRERAFKCFESETIDYNYSYVIKSIYKSIKFCEYNDNWLSIYVFKIE